MQCILCGTLLGTSLVFGASYRPVLVRGASMQPTLRHGQVVLMERRPAQAWAAHVGDVVVFRLERDTCIKRVYATGGAVVRLVRFDDGSTFLIETLGEPDRIRRVFARHPSLGRLMETRVPPHRLFVVGDNYNRSSDSRDYGPIPESAVIGTVPAASTLPGDTYRPNGPRGTAVASVPASRPARSMDEPL